FRRCGMGCDIHIWAERKTPNGYEAVTDVQFAEGSSPFDWRYYGMFGFLAGVRNYSDVPPIAEQRGWPSDVNKDAADEADWCHSHSWLSVSELSAFDYDKPVEDRRVSRQIAPNMWSGGCTADPGEGHMTTFREFLGEAFFDDLKKLVECGADRIVFCFDS